MNTISILNNNIKFLGCFNYFPLKSNEGDVIIYNLNKKEYIYTGEGKWEILEYNSDHQNKNFLKITPVTHCKTCGASLSRWEKWMKTNQCEYCKNIYYR